MNPELEQIQKKIRVLEWDRNMNQLNAVRAAQLEALKKELQSIQPA